MRTAPAQDQLQQAARFADVPSSGLRVAKGVRVDRAVKPRRKLHVSHVRLTSRLRKEENQQVHSSPVPEQGKSSEVSRFVQMEVRAIVRGGGTLAGTSSCSTEQTESQ